MPRDVLTPATPLARQKLMHALIRYIAVPLTVIIAAVPALRWFGWHDAFVFGLLLSGWEWFVRILVTVAVVGALRKILPLFDLMMLISVLMDGSALVLTLLVDPRLLWGAVPAIAFAEMTMWRGFRREAAAPS